MIASNNPPWMPPVNPQGAETCAVPSANEGTAVIAVTATPRALPVSSSHNPATALNTQHRQGNSITVAGLASCPSPGGGVNVWCLAAARACLNQGLSRDDAAAFIKAHITRPPRTGEIERAVDKVFNPGPESKLRPSIKAVYSEGDLNALADKLPGFGFEQLESLSPVDVRGVTAIQYLRHVFAQKERVILATRMTDPGTVWENDPQNPLSREDELDDFANPVHGFGAWFLSNPVTGQFLRLERLKSASNPFGETLRAEENLTSYRHLVLESDDAPTEQWLRALVQLPLPIISIASSGGRSLHALVRVDASSSAEWHAIKAFVGPVLVTLGADKNAITAVRLTRLPGTYRSETGKRQELLFLNPKADETPICQLPPRQQITVSNSNL